LLFLPPVLLLFLFLFSFFFTSSATTSIYTLSLHDALPISSSSFYQHGLRKSTPFFEEELKLSDLPALQGTEKQVKWAEDIRCEVFRVLEECRKVAEQAPERRKPKLEKAHNRLVERARKSVV